MLSPSDYYQRYHSIPVPAPGGSTDLAGGIVVDKYLLGAREDHMTERLRVAKKVQNDLRLRRKSDPNAGIRVVVRTPHGSEEREFPDLSFKEDDQLWALLRYPYVGKGSPESIEIALQLAAADVEGSPAIVEPDNFQSYCDRWLGLDCSGFVGNYLRHVYADVPWYDVNANKGATESSSLISDIWAKFPGTVRSHASEINHNDLNLLVLVDKDGKIIPGGASGPGHIMISCPGEQSSVTGLNQFLPVASNQAVPAICIVESTGATDRTDGKSGLAKSFYAYADHPQKPGVIRVHRGLNNTVINVHIKGAPWPN